MNEVYVKLMAGKRGFKIPPEVEEILLKNLQDSLRDGNFGTILHTTPKEPPSKANNVFLTSVGEDIPAQDVVVPKQEEVKMQMSGEIPEDFEEDEEFVKNSETGGSLERKVDEIDKMLED